MAMPTRTWRRTLCVGCLGAMGAALALAACGEGTTSPNGEADATTDSAVADSSRGVENAGQSCKTPAECYPGLEAGALKGAVQCLDRVAGGYCTHLCQADTDCCAIPGECRGAVKQVCSPFETMGQMCFLSCESSDLRPGPDGGAILDETTYCQTYAGADFKCRSSGGGNKNRKVCVPGGAAADARAD